jgi:hypothetical protein
MGVVIDGWATYIHEYMALQDRLKGFFLSREHVVDDETHGSAML